MQVPEYSQNFNRYSYVMNNPLNLTDPSGFSFASDVLGGFGIHTAVNNWGRENWRTVVVIVVAVVLVCTGIGAGFGVALLGTTLAGTTALAVGTATVTWGAIVAGAAIGAITGGLSAALAGGDLGDVLRGAVIGGISGALTGALHGVGGTLGTNAANVAGHGVIGGASNVAMGGKFQDGFLSGAAAGATAATGLTNPDSAAGKSLGIAGRTAIASAAGGTASALGGGKFANGAMTGAFAHLLNAEAKGFVKQALDNKTCGPASVANAIRAIAGKDVTTEQIAADIEKANGWDPGTIGKKGLLFADIVSSKVFEKYGVKYEFQRNVDVSKIAGPALVEFKNVFGSGQGHAIFLHSSNGTSYNIVDPIEGKIERYSKKDFSERYDSFASIKIKK